VPPTQTGCPELRFPTPLSAEFFRRRLAQADALPQLAALAVISGAVTGGVIVAFRLAVEGPLALLLGGDSEAFEGLSRQQQVLWPVAGALVLGLALTRLNAEDRRVGVIHVMERLSRHQGYLPWRNLLVQFFGGAAALISGQSGGREGPAIHLGAACSSLLGQAAHLPNNSMRTLVACGTAGAIGASFNTPIAGVIFAMEVVMMEYSIGSFLPVIIAAVTATLLSHAVFGDAPAFLVAPFNLASLSEIPFIIFAGVVIGTIAAAFITLVQAFARLDGWPFWRRALLAGSLTGIAALWTPEVMGVGYDTVNGAMLGQLSLMTLVSVVALKLLTSAAAVGLGLPVGVIGPMFVLGATAGGALGICGAALVSGETSPIGFYVMLGMAAMMAAVLQAPLAALMAVLELTANPNVILPAMLIIVVATLVCGVGFRRKSMFLSTLETLGMKYPPDPVTVHLQRVGVAALMNREVRRLPQHCPAEDARQALDGQPRWIAVEREPGKIRSLLNAADLRLYLDEGGAAEPLDLLALPGNRLDCADIDHRATLSQAQQRLRESGSEALCVRRTTAPTISVVVGALTQQDIDNFRDMPP